MRAFAVLRLGESPAVHDLPIPTAENELLIRVNYAGVNPIDYKLVDRLTDASPFPFVLGADFAGVVEHVPTGENAFQVGDRLFGMARKHGAYAEHTAVKPGEKGEPLAHIPEGVTDEQAAALPVPAITALMALELLGLVAGQRVVVMGATGGVGGYAVEMACSRGAHVIATVRGDVEEARKLGAEDVYDSNEVDVIDAIHASYPAGVDAVLDLVNGPEPIRRDVEILKEVGALVSPIHSVDGAWFAERKIRAQNLVGSANTFSTPEGLARIAQMLAEGTITARVRSVVGLNGTAEILDKIRNGGLRGKALIRL